MLPARKAARFLPSDGRTHKPIVVSPIWLLYHPHIYICIYTYMLMISPHPVTLVGCWQMLKCFAFTETFTLFLSSVARYLGSGMVCPRHWTGSHYQCQKTVRFSHSRGFKRPISTGKKTVSSFIMFHHLNQFMSWNGGTPKSSIWIGFSIINQQFWGSTIYGNPHFGVPESLVSHQSPGWFSESTTPCQKRLYRSLRSRSSCWTCCMMRCHANHLMHHTLMQCMYVM